MASRMATRFVSGSHEFWYRLTGGWVGGNMFGRPVLLLTTTGRKSGRSRTTPLIYVADGDDLVVVASNGGAARDPDWWTNLKANPAASVQVMSRRREVSARKADDDEKARLWPLVVRVYPGYDDYQRRTTRQIPLVILEPA
jgi:deazaflavin-dependent oxidoreductase (nitroreductase family)